MNYELCITTVLRRAPQKMNLRRMVCRIAIPVRAFPDGRLLQTYYVSVYDTVTMRNLFASGLPVSENLINFAWILFKTDVVLTVFS